MTYFARFIAIIAFIPLVACAWANTNKDNYSATRDASFCQDENPTPAYMAGSNRGVYADRLGQDGKPICLDLRGGIKF
jgi:hypothetical protein